MTNSKHNSNKELVGQIANIVTPLFGGIPATGELLVQLILRVGLYLRCRYYSWGFVLLTLLLLAPYASHIPLASILPF